MCSRRDVETKSPNHLELVEKCALTVVLWIPNHSHLAAQETKATPEKLNVKIKITANKPAPGPTTGGGGLVVLNVLRVWFAFWFNVLSETMLGKMMFDKVMRPCLCQEFGSQRIP